MTRTCPDCGDVYDDAAQRTYCPHPSFAMATVCTRLAGGQVIEKVCRSIEELDEFRDADDERALELAAAAAEDTAAHFRALGLSPLAPPPVQDAPPEASPIAGAARDVDLGTRLAAAVAAQDGAPELVAFAGAIGRRQAGPPILVEFDAIGALAIVGLLQLALRHPELGADDSPAAMTGRTVVSMIRGELGPDLAPLVDAGWADGELWTPELGQAAEDAAEVIRRTGA